MANGVGSFGKDFNYWLLVTCYSLLVIRKLESEAPNKQQITNKE
jgi:hypothetical protein